MTEREKVAKYGDVVAVVTSRSSPGDEYEVRHNPNTNEYSCQCKGWIFSREKPKSCKHTRGLLRQFATPAKKADLVLDKIMEVFAAYDTDFLRRHLVLASILAMSLRPLMGVQPEPVVTPAPSGIRRILIED